MSAPKGNKFWKMRAKSGNNPKYGNAKVLWEACEKYFDWAHDNPLHETKCFSYKGKIKLKEVPKMRAMTMGGLQLFLGIHHSTWSLYKTKPRLSAVTDRVEAIIKTQKFEGAAADLLNPAIIARDLGLKDRQELSGDPDAPIEQKWTVEFVNATSESK